MEKIREEVVEVVKILVNVFCDRKVSNKHYRFHLEKKYKGVELSEDEWMKICKNEKIEL